MTDPRLEHQGARNLAGVDVLLTSSLPVQEGRRVSAADSNLAVGVTEVGHEAHQAQRQLSCEAPRPGQHLPFPNLSLFAPRISWALLRVKDRNSLRPLR